jgi:peptide/nickel transport system permease protein
MTARLLWRIASALLVIWAAATLAFFALAILPGDAITNQLSQSGADADIIAERREAFGMNDPIEVRYLRFLLNAAKGDLGTSMLSGEPVSEAILRSVPPTFTLAASALLFASAAGILTGIAAALRLPLISLISSGLISLVLSTPIYWTGTLAIYALTVLLGLPASQWNQALPVIVLGFHTAGAIGRVTQGSIRDVLQADYVRTARAKGLRERRIIGVHVLRAALPPVISVIALQAGFLLSGAVITETLFVRPGIGRLLLDAVVQQDYPIVLGVVMLSAVIYVLTGLAAEVALRFVDPRVVL